MKQFLLVITVMLSCALLTAQKNKKKDDAIPAFGKVDISDLQMKDCDFDKKAEAVVLIDEGELRDAFGLELIRRIRIKILSDKGLDWANVHLSYRSGNMAEKITGLEAQSYNLDNEGNIVITKFDKKLLYEKKINKKYNEKVFTFPEVKVGSVIEYKYVQSGVGLIDWYFQRSIPVKYSFFAIDLPAEINVSVIPFCSRNYDQKVISRARNTVKSYSMSSIPGFRDEPFIINQDFYRDRLETKVTSYTINGRITDRVANWPQVIKYLLEDEDFGIQLKRNIPRTADLDEKLNLVSTPYDKMKIIYKYVQDNMLWNEYTGIWALEGVRSAWKDKKGTVGEINLILVNLLKDSKLNANPVLVSTHDNGVVNTVDAGTYDYPGFYQFNKVMAFVDIDGKNYVLDASQKGTPVNLIPAEILSTEGLVIGKSDNADWGWHTLANKDKISKNIILTNVSISAAGEMTGRSNITSYDYARLSKLPTAKKGKDKYIEKYITGTSPGMIVKELQFENIDSDSLPLIQNIQFTRPLTSSGDYMYFSLNILSGLEKNPFVADNRFSDVFFGTNQIYSILGNYTIPEGYEFDELPQNLRMIMPDTSISVTRLAQLQNNTLMTKIQLEFRQPVYPASQYGEFQEFYKRLFDMLNEQFVIRKIK